MSLTEILILIPLTLFLAFIVFVVAVFIYDTTQTHSAILKNYPVIGHLRYIFEDLGKFFRQYFYAMDREEMPFNRAQRGWVYRAAKNLDNTVAFGSTRNINITGTPIFANTAYPVIEQEYAKTQAREIGPYCAQPYLAPSFFNISGMSYGALSRPAIRALSFGADMANCWLNTGEGGLSEYHLEGDCDLVFQIGTAKYGVRDTDGALSDEKIKSVASKPQVKMFEIKLSQGAKPGKGGILPGSKVSEEIASIRGIPMHEDSISPNRHPDIKNTTDLLAMINRIRDVGGIPVGFKTVVGDFEWLEEMCELITKQGIESAPDFITVDGGDGGTGAAPMSLIDNVGMPLSISLPRMVNLLEKHGLRQRIRVIASGKLINPVNVAWALCMGADFTVSGRGYMFALGCIQALECNKNTCPTGITTHNERYQRGLNVLDKATRVRHYHDNLVHEVETIAHSCGAPEPRELRRKHCLIVQPDGDLKSLNEMFPYHDDQVS